VQQDHKAALNAAADAYFRRFKKPPPIPFGVTDEHLAALLNRALETGDPEIEGHAYLPEGADA
jgi:hypothetical protein